MKGRARKKRSIERKLTHESVRRIGHSESFRKRWIEPRVICVMANPDAWSAYLRRMTSRPGWTVMRLARESGIARSSLNKWISEGAVAITIESVYRVADALGDDRANALRAAGNLAPDRDAEVDLILGAPWTEAKKAEMIDRLMRRREEERQRRLDDLKWMLEQGGSEAAS